MTSPSSRQLEEECWNHYARALLYADRKVKDRKRKVRRSLLTAEELVADALVRIIDGRRKWSQDKQTFFDFFTGVISSLLYEEVRQRSKYDSDDFENVVSLGMSPEDAVERASEVNGFLQFLANQSGPSLVELARMIAFGYFDTAAQMAMHLNIPTTEVEARKKRLAAAIKVYREQSAPQSTAPGGPR